MPEGALRLPFGETVTFTFQVVDEDLNPVAVEDAEIRVRTEEWNDNRRGPDRTRTYTTDSSGRVQLTFRLTDPDPDTNDPHGELNLEVLRSDYTELTDRSTVGINTTVNRLRWSDDDPEPRKLLLEQSSVYSRATATGSAHNRVTATLLDQYGDPVRGKRVHFTSGDEHGLYSKVDTNGNQLDEAQNAYRKTTSRRGVIHGLLHPELEYLGDRVDLCLCRGLHLLWPELHRGRQALLGGRPSRGGRAGIQCHNPPL